MTEREQTAGRAAAGRIRDRLPDARQRLRSRGRGPGGAAAGAPGARRRRADRVAARLRLHRHHPPGDQRAALGPRPPRALRRRMAAGADRHRRRGRSGAPRRDRRLALGGDAGPAREPLARAARGAPAPRRLRLRLSARSRRSSARARTTCASSRAAPGATSSRAGPASRPRASSATSWRDGSSRPPSRATSPGLEALLAHDVAADRRRRRQGAGAGADSARAQPRRPHADRLAQRRRPALPGHLDAPGRGQRRPRGDRSSTAEGG